jgi:RNA polymerase sigma-70 factor (ECF subfamily)
VAPSGSPPGEAPKGAGASPLARAFLEKRENLLLFLAARTRSMAAAEDLVQELYLKVAAVDPATDVRTPVPLLYRMASNLLVDQLRSAQRDGRRNAEWRTQTHVTLGGEDIVAEPAADDQLIAKDRARQLADAVEALPPQMGRAFRLHKLEGKSQAETAEIMKVSRKMVEQHIAAAIRHLAQRLRS